MFRTCVSRLIYRLHAKANVENVIRHGWPQGVLVRHSTVKPPKPKPEMILLKDVDGKILGAKTKAEAEVMARKSHYELVLEKDGHGVKYPNYILVDPKTATKMADQEITASSPGKVEKPVNPKIKISEVKRMAVKSNISDHDIEIKCNHIMKWVASMCEVRIVITGKTKPLMETIYAKFESKLTDTRLLQKVVKERDIKFICTPDPKKLDKYLLISANSTSASAGPNTAPLKEGTDFVNPNHLFDDHELEQMIDENLKKK